jgi:hypothetical protein
VDRERELQWTSEEEERCDLTKMSLFLRVKMTKVTLCHLVYDLVCHINISAYKMSMALFGKNSG